MPKGNIRLPVAVHLSETSVFKTPINPIQPGLLLFFFFFFLGGGGGAGVSISSEVGGRPIKVGGGNTSGAARPLPLGWSGGMLPQKILESRSPEMPFPAFWHQIQY